MKIIENCTTKTLIILENNKVVATLSDGDIRIYLINGGTLDDLAVNAGNKSCCIARSVEAAKSIYEESDRLVVPIVDNSDEIIDISKMYKRFREKIF